MEGRKELALYALTPGGRDLALRLAGAFPQAEVFLDEKIAATWSGKCRIHLFSEGIGKVVARNFHLFRAHVFIMATGIVVRSIASLLTDKWHDPAVVVLDERGTWAISLLSGHWGGAHDLAREVAHKIGALPVITTATDVGNKTAIEVWAKREGLRLENVSQVTAFNAALVKNIPLFCWSEYPHYLSRLPEGMSAWNGEASHPVDFLAVVSPRTDLPRWPAQHFLLLRPPVLYLGLGCNRGTSEEEIYVSVKEILEEHGYSMLSLAGVGTIDLKADEPGLQGFASRFGLEVHLFSREELNRLDPPSSPSDYVKNILGVKGVAECAAMLLSGHQDLVITKVKRGNVTVALASRKKED
ncbi:MAG: cobalt-precorrin 5A hydrolase [bacterium]